MNNENSNYCQSVSAVVIKNGKVLLARHNYGIGKGKLIIAGGYVNIGETPQEALIREYMEETQIKIKPINIIAVRFNMHDWYIVFRAEYISGEAQSDNDENSEVEWINITDALSREDVPDLTKKLIKSAISEKEGLSYKDFQSNTKYTPYSLYCL